MINAEIKMQGNDNAFFTTNAAVVYSANIQIFHTDGRYKFTDGVTDLATLVWRGAGGVGSVESVTGSNVDNTDPLNPVVNIPTLTEVIAEDTDANNLAEMSALGRKGTTTSSYIGAFINFFNVTTGGWQKNTLQDVRTLFKGYYDTIYTTTSAVATQITTALTGYLPIAATQTTGVALTFVTDSVYGSIATPETGNITFSTTSAQLGVTNIIIHNSGTEPTYSTMKRLSISGNYVTGVINYIIVTYINSTEVIYSISQRA